MTTIDWSEVEVILRVLRITSPLADVTDALAIVEGLERIRAEQRSRRKRKP